MNTIEASAAAALLDKLCHIDISVPLRPRARAKEHVEPWVICRFLSTYCESALWDYPLRMEHTDQPDVLLSTRSICIGIEIIEAVPQNYAEVDAITEYNQFDNIRSSVRYQPGEAKRPIQELTAIARGDHPEDIWMGNSIEELWAEAMFHSCIQKSEKFQNVEFKKYAQNWLLIVDNWRPAAIHECLAADLLRIMLLENSELLPFDAIFVQRVSTTWKFEQKSYGATPVNDIWK